MIRLWALVRTVLIELSREKVFFVTFFIGLFLFALSFLLGALSFAEEKRMIGNFGLLGVFLSSAMMASYVGSFSLHKEIEKQTLLLTLSRAVSRRLLIFAKFLGFWIFAGVQILFLCGIIGFLINKDSQQWINIFLIGITLWLQVGYLFAIGLASALLMRPPLAFTWTLTVALLSFWISDLQFFAEKSQEQIYVILADVAGYILPRFDKSNWKAFYYVENGIPWDQFLFMLGHLSAWIVVVLMLSSFIFRRKDLV